jgi:uncharacterized protein YgbK (DUF1537 family)
MAQIAIVADDLSGAADAAGAFAAAGLATLVALARPATIDADVVALSTESRDVPVPDAVASVRADVAWLDRACVPPIVYKKIDSVLRGHVWEELLALLRARGERRALLTPALPAHGRTVSGGRVYVRGVPLHHTPFAAANADDLLRTPPADPEAPPVAFLDLATLRSGLPDVMARLAQDQIVVADAETDDDLDRLAGAALSGGLRVMAGSAGLARALARQGAFVRVAAAPPRPARPAGPALVVAGSRHAATLAQVAYAEENGIAVVRLESDALERPEGSVEATVAAAEQELAAGRSVILTTAGCPDSPLGGCFVAERLAAIVDELESRLAIGGLMLTGGDVAATVCRRLKADAIRLDGELAPAVPVGWLAGGRRAGTAVITKAGSFGDESVFVAAIAALTSA